MNNLDRYVKEKKEELIEKNISNELEIIKYIYLDLGKNFSFNDEFIPFGNSKTKSNLYKYKSRNINDLNKCMEDKKVICKSLSYILEYVLKRFDVDIQTITDPIDDNKYPHVFNIINLKDGRKFCVDLQDDINNIQTHSFTSNFGLESIYDRDLVINKKEQEIIDKKLGYIDDNNYYSDDYLYLLHSIADSIDSFKEKVEFILENIDITTTKEMGYMDRQWHHKNILESFFNKEEFDYHCNLGKIKMFDCYKEINGKRKYINFITVRDNNEVYIYVYNENESKYSEIKRENWFNCLEHGMIVHGKTKQKIRNMYAKQ